jgi:hypothetical protein
MCSTTSLELEPAGSDLQGPRGDVGGHHLLDRGFGEQVAHEHAFTAAEVTDAPGARGADGGKHGPATLLVERHRLVGLGEDPRALKRVVHVFRVGVVHLCEPREGVPGEFACAPGSGA